MVFISISLWCKFWKGYRMKSLCCSEECLKDYKKDGDIKKYCERYKREVLDVKDCDEMVKNLREKFGDRNICFLCYEGKGKFCHRILVRKWLNENGYLCKEW